MMQAVTDARRPLSFEELQDALAALIGERVAVRIVERVEPERLIVALEGVLGAASGEKKPSRFWPLEDGLPRRAQAAEAFGVVLHEDAFNGAEARAGAAVIVIAQGSVLVNIRRL